MSTVASVDYIAKRIYLSAATVGVPLDTMDVYRDVRALRVVNEAHRAFRPMIVAGGNIQKTATTFTQPYVQLLYGCAIVPFNAPHTLLVTRETFSDDGRSGLQCFDRSTVSAEVDIDFSVDKVEVRIVFADGGSAAPSAVEVANEVLARLLATTIPVDMTKVKGQPIGGVGTEQDPWGPA